MPLNLAPLSRGGGYPMTRLDTWQRYRARCVTAPLWKNVCNGTSVAKGWLWCCLLKSCVGFGYHTHCTLVIRHIAKSNQSRSNYLNLTIFSSCVEKEQKKYYIDGNYWKGEGACQLSYHIHFVYIFPLPTHWAAQASVFVFPMFPHHPWVVCSPPTIPALLSCPPLTTPPPQHSGWRDQKS